METRIDEADAKAEHGLGHFPTQLRLTLPTVDV